MQSHLSKFRRQVKFVSLIALGVLSACYVSEVSAGRVSLTFQGTVVGDPNQPNGGYPPESGIVPGMPVEGEVWWNNEEPVDLFVIACPNLVNSLLECQSPAGRSDYSWGNSPGPAHGFGLKIGRHTMVADPWGFVLTVVNLLPDVPPGFGIHADQLKLHYVGRGGECPDPQHSIFACQFVFELLVDPSALASLAIPSSPLPFLHPLPISPWQGFAYWGDPELQVFFTISDGGITPGPSDEPILPIDPSAPTWTMPPHFFPPPPSACGELWWHDLTCIQQHECFINPNNCRFDPPLAIGFEYEMVDGPNIVLVIPPVVGDNTYVLRRFDGVPDVTIHGGEPYVLEPAGVRKFQILGIETSDGIDSQAPTAFVTGIVTTEAGLGQLMMRPLTASPTPVARAGLDQVVNEGDPVTLDGSGSMAPQALPLTYTWNQIAGDPVTLNLRDTIRPTFIAP